MKKKNIWSNNYRKLLDHIFYKEALYLPYRFNPSVLKIKDSQGNISNIMGLLSDNIVSGNCSCSEISTVELLSLLTLKKIELKTKITSFGNTSLLWKEILK